MMAVSSTHDATARITDLFAEWDDSIACTSPSSTPSVVLCEVFGSGVLQQLVREVLGAEPFSRLAKRSHGPRGMGIHRTIVCVNAVQLSSGRLDSVLRSATYAAPPSDVCSASVIADGGARRVVYHGSLNAHRTPQMLWDSALLDQGELQLSNDENILQSRIRELLEHHKFQMQRSPVLFTISVGCLPCRSVGSSLNVGDVVQWFDIHIADGIGGSGLLPEVVARCCSAFVAESWSVSTYDAVDNASMRFWIPFLNLLHPRHNDAAVLVSVASSSHLIELHYFHDVMKKFFDASNDDMYVAAIRSGNHDDACESPPAVSGTKKLVAEALLIDHALLCGDAAPFVVFAQLSATTGVAGAASPPPKDPLHSQQPVKSGHLESVEMLIEEVEKVPITQGLLSPSTKRQNSLDNGAVLPNSSTYVAIADGSSMMSPPLDKQQPSSRSSRVVVASVFDRLLATTPSPKSVVRRRPSQSPNPGKRPPFVPGGGKMITAAHSTGASGEVSVDVELKPRAAPQRNSSTEAVEASATFADVTVSASTAAAGQRNADEEIKHALLQKHVEALQTKFDATVKELTKESETKLITKERELSRLTEKVKSLQNQLDNAIEDNLQATRAPATSAASFSEEDVRNLRAALQDAEVTIRRSEEDKSRLEQMLDFSKREAESKSAALELQLKRQQQRLELSATKKLADDAAQHESRFALARSALEKQVEALANENQMLKDDKKNLVASMRMLRQAATVSSIVNDEGEFSASSSAVVEKKLSEIKGQLMDVRLELTQIHSERDTLYQKDEAKSEQIATLQATIDMLKSQLAAERKSGLNDGHLPSGQHHAPTWNGASPSSSQQELQSFPGLTSVATVMTGGIRRPAGPIAVSRQSISAVQQPQRRASGSPARPGVAHYLLQQQLDPTELLSPRKASQR
jgi:hypothetical protein